MEPSTSMDQGDTSKSHRRRKRTASTSLDQGFPSKSHSGQEPRRLTPKHKIFLSHSGKQKDFVRQLCKDLKAELHEVFFDEEDSSLPKGERFAPFIFKAVRQCRVAVIVLSEDFLTSKWPMLELVEFVKAKKSHNPDLKLLPLFYKLSVGDLKLEPNVTRWKAAWAKIVTAAPEEGMPLENTRVHLNLDSCMEALRELSGTNGFEFNKIKSKVEYQEAIVKQISSLVPPGLLYDTSDIIGSDRLCEVIGGMFVEDKSEDSELCGTYKLGLYGMSGLGKTTMSQAVCNYFHERFNGRVLHVQLGSKSPLDLQKLMLTELLRISERQVKRVQCLEQAVPPFGLTCVGSLLSLEGQREYVDMEKTPWRS